MQPASSVTTWIGRLKAGDAGAAQELWRRYYAQLVEQAHRHLASHLRPGADAEDLAQAAFAGFCAGAAAGRFPRLDDRHDLWRVLFTLTLRRVRDLARHEARQKRERGRTLPADLLDLPEADLDRLAGDSPDPALAAEVADELRFLFERLNGDDLRQVARYLLEGYTQAEIAERLGCSQRTVERRWLRIRQICQALEEENG